MAAVLTSEVVAQEVDEGYADLELAVSQTFGGEKGQLFTTNIDPDKLWLIFIESIPDGRRQHYNCNCCRHFIQRFGGLVTVDNEGVVHSLWEDMLVAKFFHESISNMAKAIRAAKVDGVFLSSETMWGTPRSDKGWTHLSAANPKVFKGTLLTASQRAAELKQDYILIQSTLEEFTVKQIETAYDILKSEQFPGYEKGVAIAEWYRQLRYVTDDIKNSRLRSNLIWARVAEAPPGFAHLKNGMVGTLVQDIQAGKTFDECRRAWASKMHPLQYQRPTAPVTEGQVKAAEKLFDVMKLEPALHRRFANLEDLKGVLWSPKALSKGNTAARGTFGHLLEGKKEPPAMQIEGGNITWAKFKRDVLPSVYNIEIHCPPVGAYIAITAAADPEAPPILQWDSLERRNTASHYFYFGGSRASTFNLATGWNEVTQISDAPHGNTFSHFRKFLVFSIKGCYDTRASGGVGLFPEFLRAELHQVRSVIEKYSNSAKMPTGVRGDAHGLAFSSDSTIRIRCNGSAIYTLDRWE